jgi:hypothetical protein
MPLLLLSIVVATYSVLIRQYAVVPLIAIVIAGFLATTSAKRKPASIALFIACAISLITIFIFFMWWSNVPGPKSIAPHIPNDRQVRAAFIKGAGFARLGGLLLAPVLIYAGPIRIIKRSYASSKVFSVLVAVVAIIWQAVTATKYLSSQFVGNYVIRDGALSIAVLPGKRPDVGTRCNSLGCNCPGSRWSLGQN